MTIDIVFGATGFVLFVVIGFLNVKIIENIQRLRVTSSSADLTGMERAWWLAGVSFIVGGVGLFLHESGIVTAIRGDYSGAIVATAGVIYLMWKSVQATAGDETGGESNV